MEKLFILTVHAGNGLFYCPVFALDITEAHYKVRGRFPDAGFIEGHIAFEETDIISSGKEERRLERLRNLLTPIMNLPDFILNNENAKFDDLVKSTAEKGKEVAPLIKEALRPDITLAELNKLYTNPENYREQ